MLFEKLVDIYEKTECNRYYPESMVNNLYHFIVSHKHQGKENLSPYKFSDFVGISVSEAIKFFMFFSNEGGLFELVYFFDCSRSSCGDRIYLTVEQLDSIDNYVTCEECSKEYLVKDIESFISVYFKLKNTEISSEERLYTKQKDDYNSTFSALKGLPDDLKSVSPSSLDNNFRNLDEGDYSESVSLKLVVENNSTESGEIINGEVDLFANKLHKLIEV